MARKGLRDRMTDFLVHWAAGRLFPDGYEIIKQHVGVRVQSVTILPKRRKPWLE